MIIALNRYNVAALLLITGILSSPISGLAAPTSSEIRSVISQAIDARGLSGYDIEIIARQGAVILTGVVAKEGDAKTIEEISWNTSGVSEVRNLLQVREGEKVAANSPQTPYNDNEITRAVRDALQNSAKLDPQALNITTHDGVVEFSGSLKNHREIDQVLSIALMVPGVKDIKSDILIENRSYSK